MSRVPPVPSRVRPMIGAERLAVGLEPGDAEAAVVALRPADAGQGPPGEAARRSGGAFGLLGPPVGVEGDQGQVGAGQDGEGAGPVGRHPPAAERGVELGLVVGRLIVGGLGVGQPGPDVGLVVAGGVERGFGCGPVGEGRGQRTDSPPAHLGDHHSLAGRLCAPFEVVEDHREQIARCPLDVAGHGQIAQLASGHVDGPGRPVEMLGLGGDDAGQTRVLSGETGDHGLRGLAGRAGRGLVGQGLGQGGVGRLEVEAGDRHVAELGGDRRQVGVVLLGHRRGGRRLGRRRRVGRVGRGRGRRRLRLGPDGRRQCGQSNQHRQRRRHRPRANSHRTRVLSRWSRRASIGT